MNTITRNKTRKVKCGNLFIGGDSPISIQSMCNTKTADIQNTVKQIFKLENAGCEIIRIAVADEADANSIAQIKQQIHIPLIADIHFDYRLAITSLEQGIDKLRINPGNIDNKEKVKEIVRIAKDKNVPIRIGVNSGSINRKLLAKYNNIVTPECMVESAMGHIEILENLNFYDTIVALKASDVKTCVESYRLMSKKSDYPLHLGVTEAGTFLGGTIKSSIGIGGLLIDGIGDTLRVSLTDDPTEEIKVAKQLLNCLEIRDFGVNFVSCPTCGRTKINLIELAKKVEDGLKNVNKNITVAVMGCAVNGPGEARNADIGIAGGIGEALLFKKGEIISKIPEENIVEVLLKEIESM